MTANIEWEVTSTVAPGGMDPARRRADEKALNDLLSDGWEPFAATKGGPQTSTVYHLRRQVENGSRSEP